MRQVIISKNTHKKLQAQLQLTVCFTCFSFRSFTDSVLIIWVSAHSIQNISSAPSQILIGVTIPTPIWKMQLLAQHTHINMWVYSDFCKTNHTTYVAQAILELTKQPRAILNLSSSCLSFPGAEIHTPLYLLYVILRSNAYYPAG